MAISECCDGSKRAASVEARTRIEERAASMVSNLMVVLCADQPPSPVVNTGTLYT
ncbi:hypothetical protein MSAS_00980 [Mycobacterium saskatchewanense]|nr:hypothetical protein MSAS_00980 [Mycobacterium saskatchewanense]